MARKYRLVCVLFLALSALCAASCQVIHSSGCSVDIELYLVALPHCAVITKNNQLYISSAFVRPLFEGSHSRFASRILPDGGWAYFDRTGLVRVTNVAPFDNGASYFHSGLVRVIRNQKYGLATDKNSLATALYDGIGEFESDHGGWNACNGCRLQKQGEYSFWKGGKGFWLYPDGRVEGATER